MLKMAKKKDRSMFKMTEEELTTWIHLRKKCATMKAKKGKGSYSRKNLKISED